MNDEFIPGEQTPDGDSSPWRTRFFVSLAVLVAALGVMFDPQSGPFRNDETGNDSRKGLVPEDWAEFDGPDGLRPSGRRVFEEEDERELPVDVDRLFVPRWRLAHGPQVKLAFRDVVRQAASATAIVRSKGRQVALGAVVAADGWIVTKATQLGEETTVSLADGREIDAAVAAEDKTLDLALLKIDAAGLTPIEWSASPSPSVGQWLASVGPGRDPTAVGVVSVAARPIAARPGLLGILLEQGDLPIVTEVIPRSAAAKAGLAVADRVLSVDGRAVRSAGELIGVVRRYNPGDSVLLEVERDGKSLELQAELADSSTVFMPGRNEFQNHMGGRLSMRRFGFPSAIQHDTVLRPAECGGPVVDLEGRAVGLNIARAGRTESYALPAGEVRSAVERMRAESLKASAR
jgi:serine protease Do